MKEKGTHGTPFKTVKNAREKGVRMCTSTQMGGPLFVASGEERGDCEGRCILASLSPPPGFQED